MPNVVTAMNRFLRRQDIEKLSFDSVTTNWRKGRSRREGSKTFHVNRKCLEWAQMYQR